MQLERGLTQQAEENLLSTTVAPAPHSYLLLTFHHPSTTTLHCNICRYLDLQIFLKISETLQLPLFCISFGQENGKNQRRSSIYLKMKISHSRLLIIIMFLDINAWRSSGFLLNKSKIMFFSSGDRRKRSHQNIIYNDKGGLFSHKEQLIFCFGFEKWFA